MSQYLFANNAISTIANSISPTATTVNLAAGTGALFPLPGVGQLFTLTLKNAAGATEVTYCTNRVGDTLTIARAQEGTTGLAWSANDAAANECTAGTMAAMLQSGQVQTQSENYAVDVGSTNAYVGVYLPPLLTGLVPDGTPVRLKIANTNTGASTFNGGDGAVSIRRRDNSTLIGGELQQNDIATFIRRGALWIWDVPAPATVAAVTAGTDTQSYITPQQLAAALGTQKLLSGQCYLTYIGTTVIRLIPCNGSGVPVAGAMIQLPSAGVSVANTNVTVNGVAAQNLAANSDYLVALNSSGGLEYWSLGTGYVSDTTAGNVGVVIINGHPDKTLVGMIGTDPSAQFVDQDGTHLVLSWFNRRPRSSISFFAADEPLGDAVGGFSEISSSIRNTFMCWDPDPPLFSSDHVAQPVQYSSSASSKIILSGTLAQVFTGINFDGVVAGGFLAVEPTYAGIISQVVGASGMPNCNMGFSGFKQGLASGRHYATLGGLITTSGGSGSTSTWWGLTNGIPPCSITITVWG